jgi:hypothetical protein
METLEEEDLVLLFLDEPELRCDSVEPEHRCTIVAKYVAEVDVGCATLTSSPLVKLWCVGRHTLHMQDIGNYVRCRCGRGVEHWTVRPL